jgi:peptide/nickel transport system permease protein
MLYYVVRRLLQGIVVLIIVLWFTFTLAYFQKPHGALSPAYVLCGTHLTHACIQGNITALGLDQPYLQRFWDYLTGLFFHFDLGYSYKQNSSVAGLLSLYIPRTFWLAAVSLAIAVLIAVPLGILQAWRRNTAIDYVATASSFVLYSIPAFVLGFLLLDAFSYHTLGLPNSPPEGVQPWAMFTDPVSFILPIATLTALSVAGLSRFMRSQVLDVLVQDYVRTARAKGCTSKRVLFRHTMRNALGPIVVIIGLSVPLLLSGALIVEDVFNYAGIGNETLYAASNQDLPTILGITIVVTIATVIGNIAADIGLAIINPRVRIEGSAR